MAYEQAYHEDLHQHLLKNKQYYLFRARYAARTYGRYLPKGLLLEFGSGIGQNIFFFRERSIGVDVSVYARDACTKRGITTDDSLTNAPVPAGILCAHVLEHLLNPSEQLQAFYEKLPKGGKLVIVLPFSKHLQPRPQQHEDKSRHYYNWTFGTFNNLLLHHGFNIKINNWNYARGFSLFYKLPFPLAVWCIHLLGYLTRTKEIIIVAEKS